MSVLQNVLLEEADRLESIIKFYTDELTKLPKGTIFIRKIKNSSFAYRKRKINNTVISEYLGPVYKEEVQKEIERTKDYKLFKEEKRIAIKELAKLRKALKAYD